MNPVALNSRYFAFVWFHLRHAQWPFAPLFLVAVLWGVRVAGAQSYAYWNDWLTYFAALLTGYCLSACARIVLQSHCFDNAIACWTAMLAAVTFSWPFANWFAMSLGAMGVPTVTNKLAMFVSLMAAALLVIPFEVEAERARWVRREGELEAQRNREQLMERQLLEARLAALQGQIEPHFLYNTLANVRALIQQDAAGAEQLLQHLIHFLRSAMPDLRASSTTLGQELDRAHAYLDIFKLRMGERLTFDITASDEARACQIPPLSVMTLVENAIEHGIEPKLAGGALHISAICRDGRLHIDVQDDGGGFQTESGGGVGLVNLQERLNTLFGDAAELRFEPGTGGGLRAGITMPMISAGTA